MNRPIQLWLCFSRVKPFRLKKIQKMADFILLFWFPKKRKAFKKSQNFKIWLQKSQIGNPALSLKGKHGGKQLKSFRSKMQNLRMFWLRGRNANTELRTVCEIQYTLVIATYIKSTCTCYNLAGISPLAFSNFNIKSSGLQHSCSVSVSLV